MQIRDAEARLLKNVYPVQLNNTEWEKELNYNPRKLQCLTLLRQYFIVIHNNIF